MKFYRVNYSKDGGNCGGFSWHTSRRDAEGAARADYDLDPTEYDNHCKTAERIQQVDVQPTKADILRILRVFASHPDNG